MGEIITLGAWIASPLMAVAALAGLLFCRSAPHRNLVWTCAVFAGSALLLLGGGWVLGQFDLAWRDLPRGLLSVTAAISWLAVNVLTLGCLFPMEMPDLAPILRRGMKLAVLTCAVLSIYATLALGVLLAVFSFDNHERVISYQGQTLVETDEGFLDPEYHYYVYHGLLVRGKESLYGIQMERLSEEL